MPQRFINVIPTVKLGLIARDGFTYSIPDDWPQLQKGAVVEVEFGKKKTSAVVLSCSTNTPQIHVKAANRILWLHPIITSQMFELADYIASEYAVSLGVVMRMLTIKDAKRAKYRPLKLLLTPEHKKELKLTDEQITAINLLVATFGSNRKTLLHGITGSGKTEVYLKLMEKVVGAGKQVLVLVPEIALTPQTASRIASRFQDEQTVIVHSKISYGQKAVIWQGISEGRFKVLVGPRSALFAPFKDLGAIVMDEEHDSSFKQFEQHPKYDARRVAKFLSDLWRCPLVFSDATPSIETYYQAEQKNYRKVVLSRRPLQPLPQVSMVNMREEIRSGNFSIFSQALTQAITENLAQKKQIILFINRRGAYTSLLCRDCGKLTLCARCDAPLVFHHFKQSLVCHHCSKTYQVPASCADCGSHRLRFQGTGTEKVEEEIKESFPSARIIRLDSDSMRTQSTINKTHRQFTYGEFDILIGTQILARGWDLSGVGLIGVVNSDTMLAMPDYRANERTFQIITQVAGRAGRGTFPGRVIIQTFSPDNIAIKTALNHDYNSFYESEINDRKQFNYPPYSRLVKLSVAKRNKQKAQSEAESLAKKIRSLDTRQIVKEVIGPAPQFITKIKNLYGFYVIIKLEQPYEQRLPTQLSVALKTLGRDWDVDVDPDSII